MNSDGRKDAPTAQTLYSRTFCLHSKAPTTDHRLERSFHLQTSSWSSIRSPQSIAESIVFAHLFNFTNLTPISRFFKMSRALYSGLIRAVDGVVPGRLRGAWEHPAGPKTVFFWAPAFKWALVIAGIGDLARPADKLSTTQSAALAATGIIWSRYSLVITPRNIQLFSVNVFVALTGLYQLGRIWQHEMSKK